MANDPGVTDLLDETIRAIAALDLNRLKSPEEKITALARYSIAWGKGGRCMILAKKHLLEVILQNCESNLDLLNRLHGRETRDQWAH
jgi:hypothetical protein